MKALIFTPLYLPSLGGIELLVSSLVPLLLDGGIRSTIITDRRTGQAEEETIDGTLVYRLPFTTAIGSGRPQEPLTVLRRLEDIIEHEAADIVHLHAATSGSAWYLDRLSKAGKLKCPLIISQHGELAPADRLRVIRDLLERADAITGVSRAALDSALAFAPSAVSFGVIPNGLHQVEPSASSDVSQSYRLVCVGRLEREKGFDLAVRAVAKLRTQQYHATLKVVGDGPEKATLSGLAKELGVTNSVELIGILDNRRARRLISESWLLLAPSRTREGFSLVVVEAALAGVPSVVTRVGGLPETVVDGQTGVVIPPDDAMALASAIETFIGNPVLRTTMGDKARTRALEIYRLDQCARRYVDLYNAAVRAARRRRT